MSAFGILFNDVEVGRGGGGISFVGMGREWPNLGGWHPDIRKDHRLYRDPFFPRPCQKVTEQTTQYSLLQQLIGNIAMVIVKFRPRWPHTWRYAFHSLSRPTMTSGRLG